VFDQEPRILRDHLGHMRELFDSGALLLGGPAYDGRSGVALLEAPTSEQAAALIEMDPAVLAGLFRFTIQRLMPYFDAFDGTRSIR
jgi:uncharacterized protein YciI